MTQKKGNNQKLPTQKTLSESAVQTRRAYQRSYYKANKDKRKQWNNNYWERKAKAVSADPKEGE